MQSEQLATNAELQLDEQTYGLDPTEDRETDLYRVEYIMAFVEKWDELIDWEARADSEGQFFMDVLRARGKESVLDVATGTGFHSVRLTRSGFNVTSADGSAAMLAKAFENGQKRGMILKTVQADWRWLNRDIQGKYDAIICLGNSFTHLHQESDRRRALAEFYAALKHDGILIIDQRNYDAMLDNKDYSNKHKYYYAGEKVRAEPEYLDEGLARFKYSFPDGAEFTLNMCPVRKNYMRKLLSEAGFERVRTYGDFQETFADSAPDFFIHIAEKSSLHLARWGGAQLEEGKQDIREIAESYYDSDDADTFYSIVWGGQDLHIGLYDTTSDIREASDLTIDEMVNILPNLDANATVLDIGSGYGGAMRKVVKEAGCEAICLNISDVQNDTNRHRNVQQGFKDKIRVVHGAFEDIPEKAESVEIVWSQDAILHSDQREQVLKEVYRVLKPGGYFIFTDPMQADDADPAALQPVYDRLQLNSLGSFRFYREAAMALGFQISNQRDMTHQLRKHYHRVRGELLANYDRLRNEGASAEYLDKMAAGLQNWVDSADTGQLAWGIQLFRKPE
ncbi:methyltransferase domain-containing protein [Pseudovibrio sp. POLY-S9]|uniref:glycine/sarcosine N-methyltransferase n=1 Tax=Pseudovibrio sp. POLY-S9 TaxID=1576596 RepID=UPI00070F3CA9|nr:methyltransferase domain-containing protein [Pseudovibrio sp. POLY-S9]